MPRYTSEQRQHAKCEICAVDLGEQSKREQWKKTLCVNCQERANDLALIQDRTFAEAVEALKRGAHAGRE